jgi:lysophospholipase L1-like esterase
MKRILLMILITSLGAALGMSGAEKKDNPKAVKLYVIGDSTASFYYSDKYPRMGWAQVFQELFDENKLVVENKAISGRSSKSFYDEKAWDFVYKKLKKGDFVFIQFGHNDEKKDDPERYTEPSSTFKQFLKIYIDNTREKGATPVLLTPIHRNSWKDGKINDTHKEYITAIRELAKETNVPLIDVAEKTKNLFESLGKNKINEIFLILEKGKYKNYPNGVTDDTHLQENGAKEISKLIAEGIKELNLTIIKYLK